jgi:photosystem II stability/assembly factor-like uncharacterized protein
LKGNSPGINDGNHDYKFEIPVGNYTAPDLIAAVNTSINKFKTDVSYNDVSFGITGISYDYPSSKATLTFDITNRYTEPYYSTSFQNWTTPNDPSGNRYSSIPAFLGFNRSTYYQFRVYSILDILLYTDSSAAIIDTQTSIYNLTNSNNYFNIVQYVGDQCPTDLSSNSVKKIITVQLSNLTTGTTYSRLQLVNELNTQLHLNPYLTSLSSINRVNTTTQYVNGFGFSHYELDIRLNRLTTDNSENIKTAIIFPNETNSYGIWTGITSAFVFQKNSNEVSDTIAETSISQSTYIIQSKPYIYLKCNKPYYSFNLDRTLIEDISFNDYKIILQDSSGSGYSLTEYLNAINVGFTNINNKSKDLSYNIAGDFKLFPVPASINTNNLFDLKIDLTKTFTERNYLMDLSYNGKRTSLSKILNIPSQTPVDASLVNIDLSANSIFNTTFQISGTGYTIDTSYLMVINPSPESSNKNVPPEYVNPIAYNTYFDITSLQNDLNSAFNQFKDSDGNNILQGTNVVFTQNGTTVNSKLTVVIRKYLTQEDYQLYFVDPSASSVSVDYSNYGNNWINSDTSIDFRKISMSSTGEYQTAIRYPGQIYRSINYGVNWTLVSSTPSKSWGTVCVSSTGQYQSASILFEGIYRSTDYGATWANSNATNKYIYSSIAMSEDGRYQTAVVQGEFKYDSSDYGLNWSQTSLPSRNYSAVAISSTGQYQTVCVIGGYIYYTTDSGATWNQSNSPSSGWSGVSVSLTGQYQVACATPGTIYYSNNYGQNWNVSNSPNSDYYSISLSSSTGQYQTAIKNTGILYSTNYGQTWATSDASASSIMNWSSVAISSDGQYQSATSGLGIYYSKLSTTIDISNNQWQLTDASNSWAYNLKIADPSYNLADPSYNSEINTYTEIVGSSQLIGNNIYLTTTNNKIYFNPLSMADGGDGVYTPDNANSIVITLPIGSYTLDSLQSEINNQFNLNPLIKGSSISYIIAENNYYTKLRININKTYTSADYRLVFYDPYSFISFISSTTSSTIRTFRNTSWDATLGWILGFRNSTEYDLSTITPTANGTIQLTGDTVVSINIYNYFMIILDDYNQNHLNDGLVTTTQKETDFPLPSYTSRATYRADPSTGKLITSTINSQNGNNLTQKQIYAAQEVINSINNYTTVASSQQNYYSSGPFAKNVFALLPMKISGLSNNEVYVDYGGTLQNQERTYFGPVNIHRMTVKLVNDKGEVVDLNGANWSFSFICEQLYQQKKT